MAGNIANIVIEPCNATWGDLDMGFTDGDIEISPEEQSVDITAHQEGTNLLDSLRTGNTISLSLTLKEANVTKLTEILEAGGETVTPQAEITDVTCVADVAGSLNNKYFWIYSANDAGKYYVWFNVNSLGVDPEPDAAATGLEVGLSTNATASAVAAAIQSVVDSQPAFIATNAGAVVTIENAATGGATDASAGNSGFTIAVTQQGYGVLVGWGKSKNFTSMYANAKKLVLHPSRLPATDRTGDFTVWKAYPVLNSIVHSGENPKMATVEFKCFHDRTRPDAISLFALGDSV